jgi:hypothetical protein
MQNEQYRDESLIATIRVGTSNDGDSLVGDRSSHLQFGGVMGVLAEGKRER